VLFSVHVQKKELIMQAFSYTYLRQHLKEVFDQISDHHESVVITRKNGSNMIILSQEDFQAMEETAYLMRSPQNLARLRSALNHSNANTVTPFESPSQ
jgi:antitoxin YefM